MPDFNKKKGDISILYKIIMSFFLKKGNKCYLLS